MAESGQVGESIETAESVIEGDFSLQDTNVAGEANVKQALGSFNLVAMVSSLLFISSKPLNAEIISQVTGRSLIEVEQALQEVQGLFCDELHGFSLHEVGGSWQFRSASGLREILGRLTPIRGKRLSRAAAETLAVIAYRQPVQRAEIETIRGVDALPTLKTLLESKLIRIVGHQDSPGHPALYGSTQMFLEKFGLKDLSELPSVREIEQLMKEEGEVE